MTNHISYLKLIQTALAVGEYKIMRHLIDPWFCFKNNHVTNLNNNKESSAKWSDIIGKYYITDGYMELIENKTPLNKDTYNQKEHIIPLNVIVSKLKKLENPTLEEIEEVLIENVHYATISKSEDMLLNKLGLNSKMPDEYYDPTHPLYNDILARYKVANINIFKK